MTLKRQGQKLSISERDFATQVESLLDLFQWQWCHFRPAQTKHGWRTPLSGKQGLPDYIAARPPLLILFELKSESGKVSDRQQEWIEILKQCYGCKVVVWRPDDLDEITAILRG